MDVLETFIYQGWKIFDPNESKEDWYRKYSYDCIHFPVSIILVKLSVIVDFKFNILTDCWCCETSEYVNANFQKTQLFHIPYTPYEFCIWNPCVTELFIVFYSDLYF